MAKGHASRGLSVFLRLGELTCGAIVLGIVGRLLDLVDEGGSQPNARLIYAVVIASLTIIFSLFFILPMAYSFWSFPIDFFMFAAWLVVFALLETVSAAVMSSQLSLLTTYLRRSSRAQVPATRRGTILTGDIIGDDGTESHLPGLTSTGADVLHGALRWPSVLSPCLPI